MSERPIKTNLPLVDARDSAEATKLFFDYYGQTPVEFSANEVDATVSFFQSRGFDTDNIRTIGRHTHWSWLINHVWIDFSHQLY